MVIVQGVFHLDPSDVAAFLDGRKPGMERARGEQGCTEYVFGVDPLDPGRVVLSERWASRADFDAHTAGARARAGEPDPGPTPLSRELTFYEATPFQL